MLEYSCRFQTLMMIPAAIRYDSESVVTLKSGHCKFIFLNLPVLQFVVQVLSIDLKIPAQLWEITSEEKLKKKII